MNTTIQYSCTQCSKHDIQVSMVLKSLVHMINKHENGYTDILDEFNPVVKRLYLEKGYQEKRKVPLKKNVFSSSKKREVEIKGDNDDEQNATVVSSSYFRSNYPSCQNLSCLVNPKRGGTRHTIYSQSEGI